MESQVREATNEEAISQKKSTANSEPDSESVVCIYDNQATVGEMRPQKSLSK